MEAKQHCYKTVDVRGGQGLAATRNCACKVVYVDPQGRGWCRRHEPDDETKERWAKIAQPRCSSCLVNEADPHDGICDVCRLTELGSS